MTLNTQRNVPAMATVIALICICGGGFVSLIAWDSVWLILGVIAAIAVSLYLVLTETSHTRKIEIKEVDARIELDRERLKPQVVQAHVVQPMPPNIMAPQLPPKFEPALLETKPGHWVRPEAQPVQPTGATTEGWPDDREALSVAFRLMIDGKLPTRKNFATYGLNSGSRYYDIRGWLVGAGLARDLGDGNSTGWTSDAYDFDTQDRIKQFLSQVPYSGVSIEK